MRKYYDLGIRVGADMMPEDPYTDLDKSVAVSKGAGPSWWNMDQYKAKALAWYGSTSGTTSSLISIKSNGVKLHSDPFDTDQQAIDAFNNAIKNPADYAYVAVVTPHGIVSDRMFVPVTPLVHETVKTVEVNKAAVGIGILGAIGLLALVAKH